MRARLRPVLQGAHRIPQVVRREVLVAERHPRIAVAEEGYDRALGNAGRPPRTRDPIEGEVFGRGFAAEVPPGARCHPEGARLRRWR